MRFFKCSIIRQAHAHGLQEASKDLFRAQHFALALQERQNAHRWQEQLQESLAEQSRQHDIEASQLRADIARVQAGHQDALKSAEMWRVRYFATAPTPAFLPFSTLCQTVLYFGDPAIWAFEEQLLAMSFAMHLLHLLRATSSADHLLPWVA